MQTTDASFIIFSCLNSTSSSTSHQYLPFTQSMVFTLVCLWKQTARQMGNSSFTGYQYRQGCHSYQTYPVCPTLAYLL